MSYLRTVVTYHQPSEAEVDKAFLESHGIDVCLLNANTARNELGPAFYIQLQVTDQDYQRAVDILKAANPQRFGSADRVAELDRAFRSSLLRFVSAAVPAALLCFLIVPKPAVPGGDVDAGYFMRSTPDYRAGAATVAGLAAGILAVTVLKKR